MRVVNGSIIHDAGGGFNFFPRSGPRAQVAPASSESTSPIDLIADFIPILGCLDDLILIPLGIALAVEMIPKEVLAERGAFARKRVGSLNDIYETSIGRNRELCVSVELVLFCTVTTARTQQIIACAIP
ncbi:MAG: YkvA family protein [Spirochaetia bacterium]